MVSLLDPTTFLDPSEAVDFITSVLEASTAYSIIGKDLDGKILLWNEGARRIYGYEAAEVQHPADPGPAGRQQAHVCDVEPSGRGEAVLVVEDDPDMCAVTTRILAQNGYSVVPASGGLAAVAVLEDASARIDRPHAHRRGDARGFGPGCR